MAPEKQKLPASATAAHSPDDLSPIAALSLQQSWVGCLYALVRFDPEFEGNAILSLTRRLGHSVASDRLSHLLLPPRGCTLTFARRIITHNSHECSNLGTISDCSNMCSVAAP
jgi:hypothetical protein